MKLIIIYACQAIFGSMKMKWPLTKTPVNTTYNCIDQRRYKMVYNFVAIILSHRDTKSQFLQLRDYDWVNSLHYMYSLLSLEHLQKLLEKTSLDSTNSSLRKFVLTSTYFTTFIFILQSLWGSSRGLTKIWQDNQSKSLLSYISFIGSLASPLKIWIQIRL